MNLTMKLEKRNFTTEDGQKRDYYVLSHPLADGSNLEISVKGDKARLLILSAQISQVK